MTPTTVIRAGRPLQSTKPAFPLCVDNVSVSFHTTLGLSPVLCDVSLSVQRGELLAVTGPNGSGKSTLGRVLAGLLSTSRGRVAFSASTDSDSRANDSALRLSDYVQLVFQNPDAQIVGATVEEDLRFGLDNHGVPPSETPGRMSHALERAGLTVPFEQPTDTLSGGQKQRLAIASALAVGVPVLVFDEPTSMLDTHHQQHLLRTARRLCDEGHAVVWITQRLEELAAADRVLTLRDGHILFSGTPEEFFAGPCQELGFPLPYICAVAQACARRGLPTGQALTVDTLVKAVSGCR